MKLAAIYNCWDGEELLPGSINCLKDHVDLIIIIYQTVSNFGERYEPQLPKNITNVPVITYKYKPMVGAGAFNERAKRNIGIDIARTEGCTHFLNLDCDEYYENFLEAKTLYIKSGYEGSVCSLYTYFKLPTLRFETPDGYFVPFIHKIHPDTQVGGRNYPFYCDPTRGVNTKSVIQLPIFMQHFSWVRKNIERKCNNSTAKENIARGTMLNDYHNEAVMAGFYVKDYDKRLIDVPDQFNIMPCLK